MTAASIYVLNSKGTVREKMFLKNIHGKKKVIFRLYDILIFKQPQIEKLNHYNLF